MSKMKKMTLIPLILMIFTSVFGFANMPRSFYLMGYSAIPWYIISGITFFIPYAFMMSEYGAAFQNEKGGIYTWMEKSVGPLYAFVGTFMWYASYIIWMVNISVSIWIPLSNAFWGKDMTKTWQFFGLSSNQFLGILGVLWILAVTLISSNGLRGITKFTSVGGTAVALLNIVLLIGAVFVLIANGGKLIQPINSLDAFTISPNPSYHGLMPILSFLVFAIFAYGGIEAVGGLVENTENADKTFPKGVTIAAIIIAIGYSVGIFLCGIFINWQDTLSSTEINMANVAYVLMSNLGYQIGQAIGLSADVSITMGLWVARFVGLSMFLALTGAFFTLCYSPLKQLIFGTPQKLWPKSFTKVKNDMPVTAMWVQFVIVSVIILLISFGGKSANEFFQSLILMTNVAMTLPYLFLAAAFVPFKYKTEIKKPFEVFKSKTITWIASIVTVVTIGFANIFTIIEPSFKGNYVDTILMLAGPIVFSIIALIIYYVYKWRSAKTN